MTLLHKIRIAGVLLVALGLIGAPAARALEDATAFGFNNMRAAGTRPLLVVLLQDSTLGNLAHDAAFYDRLVFGPVAGGDPGAASVLAYFAEVSNGNFIWTRAGVVGPLSMDLSRATGGTLRSIGVQAAGEAGGFDYSRLDRNRNGTVAADELGVLVISNRGGAQTGFHTVNVRGMTVSVEVTDSGDRPDLMTTCHELTHQLGAIDLYGRWNKNPPGQPPASDCLNAGITLMSCTGGTFDGRQSVHLDAWHKMQLGWARPQVRDLRAGGTASLVAQQIPPIRAPGDKGPLLLYDPARGTREFFLLEYRTRTRGGYDANVASTGLAIWHVVQDGNKQPILIPSADDPNAKVYALFNRGAPNWVRAGSTLYNASHGVIRMRWLDGSDSGIRLEVGASSNDGTLLPVKWSPGPGVFLYTGTPGAWTRLGDPAGSLYAGGDRLFATDIRTGDIYQWNRAPDAWVLAGGRPGSIYAGGDRLYATDLTTGDIYQYNGTPGSWTKVGGPGQMFAVGRGRLYGLSSAGVFRYTGTPNQWEKIGGPAGTIYAGGEKLYATDIRTGDIYQWNGTVGSWTKVGGPGKAFVVDGQGRLYGLSP
jgi:M6 family metalloprotease-like protein